MSETSEIVTPALAALNAIPGVVAYRLHAGTIRVRGGFIRNNEPGCPDLAVLVRGHFIAMECKLAKGLVTEDQCREHGRIRRAGGVVHVVRSVGAALDVVRGILAMPDEERRVG